MANDNEGYEQIRLSKSQASSFPEEDNRRRGNADAFFRLSKLPAGAVFGGLIITAEPPRYGAIINEPLHPLLIARAEDGDIEAGSLNERATRNSTPTYPELARQRRIRGLVKVFVEIDENGNVTGVSKASGSPLLRQSAIDAAPKWKFQPIVVTGRRVRAKGFIEMPFVP